MHPIRTALACCLLAVTPLQAHEFWFTPIASPQAVGATVALRLEVGEFFEGEAAGFSIPRTERLRHISAERQQDLRPLLPPDAPEAEVSLKLDRAGTHLLVFDSKPLQITLEADKFHAYLHDEGLDFVKALREKNGTAHLPARERYRRHVKTLVQAGRAPAAGRAADLSYATPSGQRLEIMPLRNPLALRAGDALALKIVFENRPLAGALVKAWHKHRRQLLVIRATTSADGLVEFHLPYQGGWMVSVVHMVPVQGEEGVDWDSLWANLTFHR